MEMTLTNTQTETMRVIIADGNQSVRNSLTAALSHLLGVTVVGQASDGVQLGQLMQVKAASLVLLDYHLPKTNLALLIAQLKRWNCSVIVLCLDEISQSVQQTTEGADRLVVKSAGVAVLLGAIRDLDH